MGCEHLMVFVTNFAVFLEILIDQLEHRRTKVLSLPITSQ